MNVAFDSRAGKDSRGVGRYSRSLLSALVDAGRGSVIETHSPHAGRVDVYHSPWLEGALLHSPVPMVVTVHDLIVLKTPGELMRRGLRTRLRYMAAQRAARLIVPTSVVADDLMRALHVPSKRIHVIAEAADPVFHPRSAEQIAAVRSRYGLPEQFLLWVGGLKAPDPHKRILQLTRARRSMPLVLVGPSGQWAQKLPEVILTGQVPDDDLAAIYTAAHALVFPSSDEGFGLTPIEALACGTPVAACDVPAVREVIGQRAQLTPPDDLDALIRSAEAATKPAPAPQRWSWDDAADATWSVLEAAASAPGGQICHAPMPELQMRR